MTKEEIIDKFIELRKDKPKAIFTEYCTSRKCDSCYLNNSEGQYCQERMFDILIDHIMELEESQKADTNLEHYASYYNHSDHCIYIDTVKLTNEAHRRLNNFDEFIEWLLEPYKPPKPKYKLTKFEYDLLSSYCEMSDCITETWTLNEMQKKGYFENVPSDVPIGDILDNCEVVEE